VFGYQDIPEYKNSPSAVVKAVSRLVKYNKINRISKGRFYRPKKGLFGELKPSDAELLRSVTYKDGRLRGYVTGVALYNQLGLTTQVPRTVKIAVTGSPQEKDFGTLCARLVRARAPVRKDDVLLLQYLDVLRDIKEIPDADVNKTLKRMEKKFAALDEKQVKRLKRLALKYYGPQEKALIGMLLLRSKKVADKEIKNSLNQLTTYKLGLDDKQWPEKREWNIQ
jgi:hypothetical protein